MVALASLLVEHGLTREDLAGMIEIGLLAIDPEGRIARDDVWLLELWAEVRRAGLTDALGFETRDLAIYEEAVSRMFQRETQLIASRLGNVPPEKAAQLLERALPLVHTFIARYHVERARGFFSTL